MVGEGGRGREEEGEEVQLKQILTLTFGISLQLVVRSNSSSHCGKLRRTHMQWINLVHVVSRRKNRKQILHFTGGEGSRGLLEKCKSRR